MRKVGLLSLITIVAMSLTGCLQMFSPVVGEMSPGVYQLQAQSNAFGSAKALREKLLKKAETICNGKGFEELSSNHATKRDVVYNMGLVVPVSSKSAVMQIKCKD
ncbi:hypothetical protein [Acinetobacter rudis]|uniref:Lipoprotein n=1 Tax=Acinetobacter rudis CIP 110305 TaxID=421052 RepID=S3MXM2_9GAMM|nr:hypothetical protein [Acinetobacter rudis]EPF72157.1 hypothetical protein F945_02209 [Acinetobacter rudis CIP 110305]